MKRSSIILGVILLGGVLNAQTIQNDKLEDLFNVSINKVKTKCNNSKIINIKQMTKEMSVVENNVNEKIATTCSKKTNGNKENFMKCFLTGKSIFYSKVLKELNKKNNK